MADKTVEKAAPVKRTSAGPRVRKAKFTPYENPGGKAIASPEAQEEFIVLFSKLPPQQKAGAIWLVTQLTNGAFLAQGYSRMLRFLRQYIKDAPAPNLKF
jgi:hypothetical protein